MLVRTTLRRPVAFLRDQAGPLEHRDVLLHGREAHRVVPGQLRHALAPARGREGRCRAESHPRGRRRRGRRRTVVCIDTTIRLYDGAVKSMRCRLRDVIETGVPPSGHPFARIGAGPRRWSCRSPGLSFTAEPSKPDIRPTKLEALAGADRSIRSDVRRASGAVPTCRRAAPPPTSRTTMPPSSASSGGARSASWASRPAGITPSTSRSATPISWIAWCWGSPAIGYRRRYANARIER